MAARNDPVHARERLAGLILIASAALALALANSPWSSDYHHLLEFELGPRFPNLGTLSIHGWIADGLMAVFFLLVGLEVKREWYDGRLSTPAERRLPILAAVAGMAVPAAVYLLITGLDPQLMPGWAIPSATDIAFAVGVLALLGPRATPSIKLLLVTIAIVDDVGAVIIIALAYTSGLDVLAIGIALAITGAMACLNIFGVRRLWPYLIGFALLWLAMVASGVHPTISGVLAALTIPLGRGEDHSPLKTLEHRLHPWVMLGVMPLFGLASAGVELTGGLAALAQPLALAVLLGLFVGKQIGVFGAIWLSVRLGACQRPVGATWPQLYGAAVLCGIGFTMSLFIAQLAFPASPAEVEAAKLGILAGSVASALLGWGVLRLSPMADPIEDDAAEAFEIFGADQRGTP